MKAKQFLQLFVPPIYFRLKAKIKYGSPMFPRVKDTTKTMYEDIIEINKKHHLSLTDIEGLSQEPLHGGTMMLGVGNEVEANYYGSYYILQKYADVPFRNFPPTKLNIQHGIICEMFDWEKRKIENVNWVWSLEILRMYREHTSNPHITAIGSPFFYAKSILTQEGILEEKKRLGKNLLAFPSHSTYYADVQYDSQPFISLLKEQKKQFDTVRVCVYWRDYQRGLAKPYIDAGFECVCCGHLGDPFFLERHRALLEIADATIANAIGSFMGYSVFLNKPHWLVPDTFELKDLDSRGVGKKEVEVWDSSPKYAELRKPFLNNSNFVITDKQRRIVDKYWGTSCIKSQEEIRALIEDAYRLSDELSKS